MTPDVTCIMPTRDRQAFVERAVGYFLRASAGSVHAELIIVDDGILPVRLPPDLPSTVRLIRLDHPASIGEKRNLACEAARGAHIAHWDDDDWQHPDRLRLQLRETRALRATITGHPHPLYFDLRSRAAYRYVYRPAGERVYLVGNSLMYPKRLWERTRFQPRQVGEDDMFVRAARAGGADVRAAGYSRLVIGIAHDRNVSRKSMRPPAWEPVDLGEVASVMGRDLDWYLTTASERPRSAGASEPQGG